MSQNDMQLIAGELAMAIEITMSPNTSQSQRMEAYEASEKFKNLSPLCAQAGLYLVTSPQYSAVVKHFGLQLMEHQVKSNWNKISQEEKVFIKENTMKLLSSGVGPVEDKSLLHIKDVLSRIVVEMIKREWPAQWTTLLSELSSVCDKGLSQTELVVLVFLRLVEDVAILQTIESNQRRKDIYQALTVHMSEIFTFFLGLIERHVHEFTRKSNAGCSATGEGRVVQVILSTLTEFVEWVSIQHVMASNGRLLQMICNLLEFSEFQLAASDCLVKLTNRKGVVGERKPLLFLFNDETMHFISMSIKNMESVPTEAYHQYLKKLTQAMQGLATLLTTMWGKETELQTSPRNFVTFLQIVLAFVRHPSVTVNHGGVLIWLQLAKSDAIAKDPIFMDSIRPMIELIGPKIIKRPYPKVRSSFNPQQLPYATETYSSLDYDSEEEYLQFVTRFRTDMLEIFRQTTLLVPLFTFGYCEQWLNLRLEKSQREINTSCSITDPAYLEWEAIVAVLDGVLSRILLVTERPPIINGLRLLEKCVMVKTQDPLIFSIVLSCVSSLFVFLSMSSAASTSQTGAQLLPLVLDKIFSAIVFNLPDETPFSIRSAATKTLRRHAASSIVKISLKYPLLLLPIFDQINTTAKNLPISDNERLMLQEALLIISNNFFDFEKQSGFIAQVIQPANQLWMDLSPALKSPANFIDFIGLSGTPADISKDLIKDVSFKHRSSLLLALNTVLSVIKRCQSPDDPDKILRGCFIVSHTDSGNPIIRNPAALLVIPQLQNILTLLRILNELWFPSSVARFHDGYKQANSLLEIDKKLLLGVVYIQPDSFDPVQQIKKRSPLEYMQIFITTLFDNSYHLLGAAGVSLGRDLYNLDGLAQALIGSCLANLENVPDYRLRTIIRVFLKSFVYSCPPDYHESVILPIFSHLAPFMLQRLTSRWDYIGRLYAEGSLGDETNNNDTQEVLDDILNRNLTRDYIEILKISIVGGGSPANLNAESSEIDMQDDQSMDVPAPRTRPAPAAIVSELGRKLLNVQGTNEAIVTTVFNCIAWNDSSACLKATLLGGPIIRLLASDNLLTPNMASVILMRVLQGLQVHGKNDPNQSCLISLGVQVYEIIRPLFPNIVLNLMQQIPNINSTDLQKLDEKVCCKPQANQTLSAAQIASKTNKIDKNKKDLFRKITSGVIQNNKK
ncbi:unnamed protein product [Diamesa hyperborea]